MNANVMPRTRANLWPEISKLMDDRDMDESEVGSEDAVSDEEEDRLPDARSTDIPALEPLPDDGSNNSRSVMLLIVALVTTSTIRPVTQDWVSG